jgi:hypothetical protein
VPEPLGHLADVAASVEQEAGAGVAEGVEGDARDPLVVALDDANSRSIRSRRSSVRRVGAAIVPIMPPLTPSFLPQSASSGPGETGSGGNFPTLSTLHG